MLIDVHWVAGGGRVGLGGGVNTTFWNWAAVTLLPHECVKQWDNESKYVGTFAPLTHAQPAFTPEHFCFCISWPAAVPTPQMTSGLLNYIFQMASCGLEEVHTISQSCVESYCHSEVRGLLVSVGGTRLVVTLFTFTLNSSTILNRFSFILIYQLSPLWDWSTSGGLWPKFLLIFLFFFFFEETTRYITPSIPTTCFLV